ncbi:MAG: flagellar assembly factor FliW [Solirubrobacteraceae bacterium]|jgi:flagellar assembly factor FliW|nr:flagellar assembly factor FliW [Solirubrobacteraceae bacterium]
MSTLTVHSTRFGTIEIEAEAVLSFPRGLIGLGGSHYALLTTDPDSPFSWLHSVEDPDLALPVTRPAQFFPGYEVVVSDAEADALGLGGEAPSDIWVTVRAAENIEDFTVNLRAPIVVTNSADGPAAFQVINELPDLDVRTPLFAASAASGEAKTG